MSHEQVGMNSLETDPIQERRNLVAKVIEQLRAEDLARRPHYGVPRAEDIADESPEALAVLTMELENDAEMLGNSFKIAAREVVAHPERYEEQSIPRVVAESGRGTRDDREFVSLLWRAVAQEKETQGPMTPVPTSGFYTEKSWPSKAPDADKLRDTSVTWANRISRGVMLVGKEMGIDVWGTSISTEKNR